MSYREAVEDGIRTERSKNGGSYYYPPCHICGSPVFSWAYVRGNRYTCLNCKAKEMLHKQLTKDEKIHKRNRRQSRKQESK